MSAFTILDATNAPVFEDDDLVVTGIAGQGRFACGSDGTAFVAVAEGRLWYDGFKIEAGMYGCLPLGHDDLTGIRARALCVVVKRYRGIFSIGGPIEPEGRLRYIDGCTDSGLIQPLRRGDPCLNGLFFPPGIKQTRHYHPSHRIGLVFDGEGLCHTDEATIAMRPGALFLIRAGGWHAFETARHSMRILAFHPDSEVGPTDEAHQMLNATLTRGEAA